MKSLESEGIYTGGTVECRVLELSSRQPVGGLSVRLTLADATLAATATAADGTFSLPLTAERQAEGCRVVVGADSLYLGTSADVPSSGFGRKVCDLGVLYVQGPGLPVVRTDAVPPDAITATSATLAGCVEDDLRSAITARGFAYSTAQYPTLADSLLAVGGTLGQFSATATGLRPGTTYFLRAFATNALGTAYGEQQSFTTLGGLPSVLTATEVSLLGVGSAQCGGTVVDDGGFAVTARGVCWSIAPEPTVANSHTADGSGLGAFVSTLAGLAPSTTYYLRAYATNPLGTAYGEQRTDTTPSGLPTVSTTAATSVTATSAVCGGQVTADGGYVVTARGVCYSTSPGPTTAGPHTADGAGTGSFVSHLTSLTPSTTYYLRAYATNALGTAYGPEHTFTTGS